MSKKAVMPSVASAAAAVADFPQEPLTIQKGRQNVRVATPTQPPAMRTLAPAMPWKIDAVLHEEWNRLDTDAEKMLGWIREQRIFHEFAHGRDPFYVHLRGTWAMLENWDQPQDTCRCGLLHSAYSRMGFDFRYFDITDPKARDQIRSVIGGPAEQLVYNYCSAWDLEAMPLDPMAEMREVKPQICMGKALDPAGYEIASRLNDKETRHVSARDLAKFLVGLVADVADQLTAVNGYTDVYQVAEPNLVWPGDGAPGISMYWFSKVLVSARPFLDVVPPVFNNCTEVLEIQAEIKARDLYWKAVQGQGAQMGRPKLSNQEQDRLFRETLELNPYVAEPHIMLSQLAFNRGAFAEAVHEAATGLDILYQWGTHWDKRVQYAQWVGFARMAVFRATRRLQGLKALPYQLISENSRRTEAIYLQDVLKGLKETMEGGVTKEGAVVAKSRL
mmetsp:Transcript_75032/g.160724  ORF Transcript_75032/g.160724 Transcript_75032/m.160724 type:complete len:446 (-) Transcript_75032:88-1425(-)